MSTDFEDESLHLRIALNAVMPHLLCPVCLEVIERACVTPCGHSFCRACLEDCLDHREQCPACNADCARSAFRPNVIVDAVIASVQTERDAAARDYFANVISGGSPASGPAEADKVPAAAPNAVAAVFQRRASRFLQPFEDRYLALADGHARAMAAGSAPRAELEATFEASVRALTASYETYLDELERQPVGLPLNISVTITTRNGALETSDTRLSLVVPSSTTVSALREAIRADVERAGAMSIAAFVPSNVLVAGDIVLGPDEERTLHSFGLGTDATVTIKGVVTVKMAGEDDDCIVRTGVPDGPVPYFACATCKLNWICPTCINRCHAAHETQLYVRQRPKYALCKCRQSKQPCQFAAT